MKPVILWLFANHATLGSQLKVEIDGNRPRTSHGLIYYSVKYNDSKYKLNLLASLLVISAGISKEIEKSLLRG